MKIKIEKPKITLKMPNFDFTNFLRQFAELYIIELKEMTKKGLNIYGEKFVSYTKNYFRKKEESGRNTGIVDLSWSGRMLKSMAVLRVDKNKVIIGFSDDRSRPIAYAHNTGQIGKTRSGPTRYFFGVSAALIKKALTATMKEFGWKK